MRHRRHPHNQHVHGLLHQCVDNRLGPRAVTSREIRLKLVGLAFGMTERIHAIAEMLDLTGQSRALEIHEPDLRYLLRGSGRGE